MTYFLILFFSLFFFSPPEISAQNPNLSQYQNDYQYQLDQYQKKYQDYLEKKQVNQKYNTLNTEKEYLSSSKSALASQNEMLLSYLRYLRVRLDDLSSADTGETQSIQSQLFQEETWLESQKLAINQLADQNQLTSWLDSFKQRYLQTQKIISTALIQHQVNHQTLVISQLENIIDAIKSTSSDTNQTDQWLLNLPQQFDSAKIHLNAAKEIIKKAPPANFDNFTTDSQKELSLSQVTLEEIKKDLRSIITKFIIKS